jgi:hypothetical protein
MLDNCSFMRLQQLSGIIFIHTSIESTAISVFHLHIYKIFPEEVSIGCPAPCAATRPRKKVLFLAPDELADFKHSSLLHKIIPQVSKLHRFKNSCLTQRIIIEYLSKCLLYSRISITPYVKVFWPQYFRVLPFIFFDQPTAITWSYLI